MQHYLKHHSLELTAHKPNSALEQEVNCSQSNLYAFYGKKSAPKRGIQLVVTDAGPKNLSGYSILLYKVRGENNAFITAHTSFSLNHAWIQSKKLTKGIKLFLDWTTGCCQFILTGEGLFFTAWHEVTYFQKTTQNEKGKQRNTCFTKSQ